MEPLYIPTEWGIVEIKTKEDALSLIDTAKHQMREGHLTESRYYAIAAQAEDFIIMNDLL